MVSLRQDNDLALKNYKSMKLSKSILALALLFSAGAASAFTLYDAAPALSLPESHAIRYSFNINVGYDSNINSSSVNEKGSLTSSASLGASYSEVESLLQVNYDLRLGFTVYQEDADGLDENLFSNSSLTASVKYQVDSRNRVSGSLYMNFSPDQNYGTLLTAPNRQGDVLFWTLSGDLSHTIDSRWSANGGFNTSGVMYTQGSFDIDDRQYASVNTSLSYAYTTLTSLSLNLSGRFDFRTTGLDSENIYLTASLNSSLSPVSSISANLGLQNKYIADESYLYPNMRVSYNHRFRDDLGVQFFASFDNENVGTARHYNASDIASYLSDAAWRLGVSTSYRLFDRQTITFSCEYMHSTYTEAENNLLADSTQINIVFRVGTSWRLTPSSSLSLNYSYSTANEDAGDYDRHYINMGYSYSF